MFPTTKTFSAPISHLEHIPISIVDSPCSAENLVLTTWSSASVLSKLLHKLDIERSQLHSGSTDDAYAVLELGAGTGLSGLAAAAVWGTRALLTDLPPIVPGIHANVERNADVLGRRGAAAAVASLDWKMPDVAHVYGDGNGHGTEGWEKTNAIHVASVQGFPIVLAADTMYAEDHPRLLTNTILATLRKSPGARAIVVYAMRIAYIDYMREFWERMEEGGLMAEMQGREEIDLNEWDDEKLHEWSVWRWKHLSTSV